MKYILSMFLSTLLLIGCANINNNTRTVKQIGNPTAEHILTQNKDADIFMLEGIVYGNAENNDWVKEAKLTLYKIAGEVTKKYKVGLAFENGMATKLPIGTIIYTPTERRDILIAKVNGKEIRYIGLREG